MPQPPTRLVVIDLDNTLWDALGALERAAKAYVTEVSRISGLPEGPATALLAAALASGHAVSLAEAALKSDALRARHPGQDPKQVYGPAAQAFDAAWQAAVIPYPGAAQTIADLRAQGVRVVCFTESRAPWLNPILDRLGISFDAIYAAQLVPSRFGRPLKLRPGPASAAGPVTLINSTKPKSSAAALRLILTREGVAPADALVIGDRPDRDIAPALALGARAAHAAYGTHVLRPDSVLVKLGLYRAGPVGGTMAGHKLNAPALASPGEIRALVQPPPPARPRLRWAGTRSLLWNP